MSSTNIINVFSTRFLLEITRLFTCTYIIVYCIFCVPLDIPSAQGKSQEKIFVIEKNVSAVHVSNLGWKEGKLL